MVIKIKMVIKNRIEQKAGHSLVNQHYLLSICYNQGNTRLQDEHKNEQDPILSRTSSF